MNIVSYDIEEWYIEKKFYGARKERYDEFDKQLYRILDTLDELEIKATFFCVGKLAKDFSYVIKKISDRGHEIGCHSNEHMWLTKMTPKQLYEDTYNAVNALEDVCGSRVFSYRAPAFSIGEANKWAIEILAECGIERDASIFSAKRDFGGFESFPTASPVTIEYNGIRIKEFPICLTQILGKKIAFSGGGYFRFFPYAYIERKLSTSEYSICYFHIGDLLHNKGGIMSRKEYETYFKENGSYANRLKRYIKSNLGTKSAFDKMDRILHSIAFVSIEEAESIIDWHTLPIVAL